MAMHARTDSQVELALHAVTYGGAQVMGLDGYVMRPGDPADLVAIPARTPAEAVAGKPPRSLVVKAARITVRDGVLA
ncbi:hypothetical protein ABZ297_28305 [Nonomuraea sp. NPDC005983]|uniref:hypothetical protein n=1 Tax=Nonomuraea sp. NPDC005983 TaxID=3155595 RepID=UPI0033B7EECF